MVRHDRLQLVPRYDSGACASSGIALKDGAFDLTDRRYDAPSPRPRGAMQNLSQGCVMGLPARYNANGTGRDTYCVGYKQPHPGRYDYAKDLRRYERSSTSTSANSKVYRMPQSPRPLQTNGSRRSMERLSTPKSMFPSLTGPLMKSPRTSEDGGHGHLRSHIPSELSAPDLSPRKARPSKDPCLGQGHATPRRALAGMGRSSSYNISSNWLGR